MSKGAFNFNTQAVSSFELARRQEYKSEPEFLYYNAQIINNSTETISNQKDPVLDFKDSRIKPIVKKVHDYHVTVENFTIDGAGKNLPLFIPQIRKFKGNSTTELNRNPNDTIYDITFTWTSGGTQVIQSTRTVQWESENLATWASKPLPYGEYVGPQPEIPYYYCYTYSHWLKLVNATLACAWEDVKLAAAAKYPGVDFGTKCPFFKYNTKDNLFSLWQDSNTCVTPYGSPVSTAPFRPTNAPNPLDVFGPSTAEGYSQGEFSFVGYNTNFEGLFTNFPTKYYGSGTLLSESGIIVNNPLGNENCGVSIDPEVDTVVVSEYDGTVMTVTWDATPNPVPSSNWAFELPLGSTSSVAAIASSTVSFTLTGNPVAQYLYAPLKIEGRSYSSTGPTGVQTSSFQGTIVSYTQSTGALVINNLSNITPVGVTGGVTGTNWKFELGPLTSSTSVKPTEGDPLTLAVNLDPTQTLVYEGTAVDLISTGGETQTVSGNVLSYELSLNYNGGFTGADPNVDGFKYTSASTGPTGKFNPYVTFKAQDGVFQPGDFVEGSQSQATGKVIQVLAGNTNLPNTININNLNGSFKVGDLVGLSEGAVAGLGTIVDISGPNEGTPDVQPMIRLTFSGQKNPFQINDLIYVGNPAAPAALGRITDIIGNNTGYARVGFNEQDGQFGPLEYIVNVDQLGGGQVISIEGENTGYATITYINAEIGGAPSKFIAGEFLTYQIGTTIYTFAQVIIDNTDATDPTYGNQGNITARILTPSSSDLSIAPPPATGSLFIGSQSGTEADFGGFNYQGSGSLVLGNVNGNQFLVGNRIIRINEEFVSTALITNFNYIDGGQLIVEVQQGSFQLNDIIYGVTQTAPQLYAVDNIDNAPNWISGDVLTWTGGNGTLVENQGEFFGASYLLVNNVQGSPPIPYDPYTGFPGTPITNTKITVNLLGVTGVTGGFYEGESITNVTTGGSAVVSYITPDTKTLAIENVVGTFSAGNTIEGTTGFSVVYDATSYVWVNSLNMSTPASSAAFDSGMVVTIPHFVQGTIANITNSYFVLNPYQGGGVISTGQPCTTQVSSTGVLRSFRIINNQTSNFNIGDKLISDGGAYGTVDGIQVGTIFPRSFTFIYLINCGGPEFHALYQITNQRTNYIFNIDPYSTQTITLQVTVNSSELLNTQATVSSYTPNGPSTGLFITSSNSQSNAQVQTVFVDEPPNIEDTVLTVQNITGDFPIGSEIVDLETGSGAQVTQTSFQNGLMIVQPINGTFETSDRMVGPDGSARFIEQIQQTLSGLSGSTATGTAAIKEDDGTYLTLADADGSFVSNGTFIIIGPYGTSYAGVTGLISQIPNFIVGKEIWASGGVPGPNFAQAIVVSDTGSAGSAGTVVIGNVQSGSTYGWRSGDYIRQYWNNDGTTLGSYVQATLNAEQYNFRLTILPNSSGVTGNSWQIKPSIATSSTLATPSVNGQSVLEMNLNDNEVVFNPGDTLKVTQYEPILPVGPIYLPENVVQVDLSAGNGVVETLKSIFPSSPNTGATYVVLVQDYESTSTLWSPIASIVLTTVQIPVFAEFSGQQIILGTSNNGNQGNDTTASFQQALLETPIDNITPQVGYRGMLKYERKTDVFSALTLSNDDLSHLDIGISWRNRLTNTLIPLTLFNGGSTNVRLLFKKISE